MFVRLSVHHGNPGGGIDDVVHCGCRANQLWLTDITEHMTADLAVNALRMAVQHRRPTGTAVHSDRGSQFRSRRFVLALGRAGLVGSMGGVGAAADNAAMKSSFALLQKNVLDQHSWATRHQLP